MARWEPDARGRLQQAAMELFARRGYTRTTVEDIAAQAGLTERTFFRYFADKREVLFGGAKDLEESIAEAIARAPKPAAPLAVVAAALAGTAPVFEPRRVFAQKRQALIAADPELRERELIKLASLAAVISASLQARGSDDSVAGLIAETGIAIFKSAFERWLADPDRQDLSHHVVAALDELRAATAATTGSPGRARVPRTSGRKPSKSRRTSP